MQISLSDFLPEDGIISPEDINLLKRAFTVLHARHADREEIPNISKTAVQKAHSAAADERSLTLFKENN